MSSKRPFVIKQTDEQVSVFNEETGELIASDLLPLEAQMVANEANAIHAFDGTLSLYAETPSNTPFSQRYLEFPRSVWLKFAIDHFLVNFFYSPTQGLFTNHRAAPKLSFSQTTMHFLKEDWLAANEGSEEAQGLMGEDNARILNFLVAVIKDLVIVQSRMVKDMIQWMETSREMFGHYQRRGGQEFYFNHNNRCFTALSNMRGFVITHEMELASLFHDVIERIHPEEMLKLGTDKQALGWMDPPLPTRSVDYILMMTRLDETPREVYYTNLVDSEDVDLMLLKLVDVNDNGQINPAFIWDGWDVAMYRYTNYKVGLTNRIRTLLGLDNLVAIYNPHDIQTVGNGLTVGDTTFKPA